MTNTDTPAVKPVDTQEKYNARDVAQWLKDEQCRAGVNGLTLSLHARDAECDLCPSVMASVNRYDFDGGGHNCNEHAHGHTVAEAIAAVCAKIAPADLAAQKREQAAKLLREADSIEAEAANV